VVGGWRKSVEGDHCLIAPTRTYHVVKCGKSWFADGHTRVGPSRDVYVEGFASLKAAKKACEKDSKQLVRDWPLKG
jgi:hypothetical protein